MYLDAVVKTALDEAKGCFAELGFRTLPQHDFPSDELIAAWKGSLICDSTSIEIIVGLPAGFPDEIPKVYLTPDFDHLPIPHVDGKRFVCTYDSESVDFFSERVCDVIYQSIEKARGIITEGLLGANTADYETEFLAYWEIDCQHRFYSFFDPDDTARNLVATTLPLGIVVGEDEASLKKFAENLFPELDVYHFHPALYLPFPSTLSPPFPKNNGEIFALLDKLGPTLSATVLSFLEKHQWQGIIVFSVKSNGSYALAGWRHVSPNIKQAQQGFRPGKVPHNIVRHRIAQTNIEKVEMQRCDSIRIQERVGNSSHAQRKKTICIIGCGSIGSKVAGILGQSGIEKFLLIDKDCLEIGNIGRHLCGLLDIRKSKVKAVSDYLLSRYPYMNIKLFENTFHKAFSQDENSIMKADLIISVTANPSLERRLNKMQMDISGFPPVLYSWIEPFGIASHALLIESTDNSCFECTLSPDDLSYKYQALKCIRGAFTRSESGCQSTFIPYSGLEADQAALLAARTAIKFLLGEITQNTRSVFLGELSSARNKGLEIDTIYAGLADGSTHTYPIERFEHCLACSP